MVKKKNVKRSDNIRRRKKPKIQNWKEEKVG